MSDPARVERASEVYTAVSGMMMRRGIGLTDQDIRMLGELDFLQTFLRIECDAVSNEKEALQDLLKEKPEMCKEKLAKGHYTSLIASFYMTVNKVLYGAWSEGGVAALIETKAPVPFRLIRVLASTVNSEDRAAVEYLLAKERLAAL